MILLQFQIVVWIIIGDIRITMAQEIEDAVLVLPRKIV